jgi:hypothetical protein
MQENPLALLQAENESIIWKFYMWNLPRGVLKFAVNSSIDILPTFTNLNCQLCGKMRKQTLVHVFIHCKHTLDQGTLTWRHNSILNDIASCLKSARVGISMVELYCDLDGLQAPGGRSIQADVMVQAQRLDLIILASVHGSHRIALVELICPWEGDAKRAKERKTARYADLKTALSNEGWDCSLYLIKVGPQGHILKSLRNAFGRYSGLGSLQAIGQVLSR